MCTRFPFLKASVLRLAVTVAIGAVSVPSFAQGGMYVSEFGADQVRVINATGTASVAWGGLDNPWGLALDPGNNLYVVESDLHRVASFNPGGTE
ncbi:MAG: hypothetical protein H7Y38_01515 [Armatimonadetes bacterium]|nr:hypothetical protein [Armatimonadota bacterium]